MNTYFLALIVAKNRRLYKSFLLTDHAILHVLITVFKNFPHSEQFHATQEKCQDRQQQRNKLIIFFTATHSGLG
jgi:hypothetical protein